MLRCRERRHVTFDVARDARAFDRAQNRRRVRAVIIQQRRAHECKRPRTFLLFRMRLRVAKLIASHVYTFSLYLLLVNYIISYL